MNKKVFSLVIVLSVMAFSFAGCTAKSEAPSAAATEASAVNETKAEEDASVKESQAVEETKEASTQNESKQEASKDVDTSRIHSEFKKVADYVYEVTYYEYEEYMEAAKNFLATSDKKSLESACSSIQSGMVRGRNYDWKYDNAPAIVIHVPATKTRHASLGVLSGGSVTPEILDSGEEMPIFQLLPYATLDGINDAGLTINFNVVPSGDLGRAEKKSTDPSDNIHALVVTRLVLDNAGTIEEALEIIRKQDIYVSTNKYDAHFMISGKASATDDTFKTVIVELVPDENNEYEIANVIEKFVDDKPVMTNFYLTGFDGTEESLPSKPLGYERYQILMKNFNQGSTVRGMLDLMKKVYYTKSYDTYMTPFWYSDMMDGADIKYSQRGEESLNGDLSKAGAFEDIIRKEINNYYKRTRSN
ncbi:MAG: carcinine hydrolase/isopenicillin-N N-acyltransferase family protein [Eubacteriales bacterium]|nr:carcinine hydrolase/isopenicillin-N N-acyltransferase family protein [Eubacteriales bacterium]